MKLRDARLADAKALADVFEFHALKVVHPHDVALSFRELLDGPNEGRALRAGLRFVTRIFVGHAEAKELFGSLELIEAEKHDRLRCSSLRLYRGRGSNPPREPVLRAELVQDGALDSDPSVGLEGLALTPTIAAEAIDEPTKPSREEVIADDVRRKPSRELVYDLMDERQVTSDHLDARRRATLVPASRAPPTPHRPSQLAGLMAGNGVR
jgi:hypothetical protein